MGDMFAQPAATSLCRVEAGLRAMTSKMCFDESIDILLAIANAPTDADKGTTAPVGSLSVECSQAASEQLGCFDGSQKHVVASCGGIRHESPSGVRLRGGLQWIFERK
jgi:hypothetical protein